MDELLDDLLTTLVKRIESKRDIRSWIYLSYITFKKERNNSLDWKKPNFFHNIIQLTAKAAIAVIVITK